MKSFFKKLGQSISDLFYDLSCALYKLKPQRTNAKPVSGIKSKRRKDMIFYCCMMALPLFQFAVMWISVNINSILLSFKEYDVNMGYTWTLNNFAEVVRMFLSDELLQTSIGNSAKFYLITTVISLPTSLAISFYFYKKWFLSRVLKIMLFIPSVISAVVTVTCFYYLADRGWPMLVELLTGEVGTMGLLVNSETRLPTLLFYNIFYSLAGSFLFYSSAMSGIDNSIAEAAQIDGANMLQEFFNITLPMIYPTLTTFVVAGLAGSLIGDYGMYAFSKTSGGSAVPTMGYYFTYGIMADTTGARYPHYAALGLVLSALTCIIVFSARAIMNRFDPFRDTTRKEATAK